MKIVGIQITDREKEAGKVQEILTEFGCFIKTRLGLHEAERSCSPQGLILLELTGSPDDQAPLEAKLGEVEGVRVKTMEF